MVKKSRGHRGLLVPLLVVLGALALMSYGVIALMSEDPLWFLGNTALPRPQRIVVRIEGQETVLTASSPGYELLTEATEQAMSSFARLSLLSGGLSEETLAGYQESGVVVELYFDEPVDVHLPFNDGRPTALLIPLRGQLGGKGYVFRGKDGRWWAGQLMVRDPQPLMDALVVLGYIQ
jgi:hypothetical protein